MRLGVLLLVLPHAVFGGCRFDMGVEVNTYFTVVHGSEEADSSVLTPLCEQLPVKFLEQSSGRSMADAWDVEGGSSCPSLYSLNFISERLWKGIPAAARILQNRSHYLFVRLSSQIL